MTYLYVTATKAQILRTLEISGRGARNVFEYVKDSGSLIQSDLELPFTPKSYIQANGKK